MPAVLDTRCIELLADLLLVHRLPPFRTKVGKRLVKSSKVYVRNSGLVHELLRIPEVNALAGHPVVGSSWEGFVIENVLAAAPEGAMASFYRASAGAEVDLALEMPSGEVRAVEIKRGLTAKPRKGFHNAPTDLMPDRSFVVHSGDRAIPDHAEYRGDRLTRTGRHAGSNLIGTASHDRTRRALGCVWVEDPPRRSEPIWNLGRKRIG